MENTKNRLECRTCPYELPITEPIYSRRTFPKKERDDIFGGPQAWDNADKTKTQCPAEGCEGAEAAFFQVQIRSADEPMTTFLKVRYCNPTCDRSFERHRMLTCGCEVHDVRHPLARELAGATECVV